MSNPFVNVSLNDLVSRSPLISIDGSLEWSIRIPLSQIKRDDDIFYTTQSGDVLTKIAFKYYGTTKLWWVVYDYNIDQLLEKHPLYIPAGITLRLPSKKTLQLELLNGNSPL